MTTFVDTNVLIGALDPAEVLHAWCVEQLAARQAIGPLLISDIVYCELSIGLESKEATDAAVLQLAMERLQASGDALFLGGRAFRQYKDGNAGPKLNVLPDFLIGAQATSEGVPLLTCNAQDFTGYFPDLEIISPSPEQA